MGYEATAVLLVLALVIGLLAVTRISADAVVMGGLTLLLALPVPEADGWRLGIIPFSEAVAGFSNAGLLTVGVLFVVVAGLRETGAIDWIADSVLGVPRTLRGAMARLVFPVSGLSAFMNNTPVVAMLIPAVNTWTKRLGLPSSKLMMPLSYAAILGGMCSLIGTSTNLVVAGLVIAQTDLAPIEMFDVTWVGLPCAAVGLVYLMFFVPRWLPARGSVASQLADPREYIAEMLVPENSPLVGRSIEEAGLRRLPGAYVVEIEREGEQLVAVGPEQRLRAGDRLVFAGIVDSIKDLQRLRGLVPATNQVFKLDSPRYRRSLFEAVVSDSCPVAGRTIREGRFRTRYNAAVIAVARNGERVKGKIGDIELRPGDTLLLEANPNFAAQLRDSRDFLLVSEIQDSTPRRHEKAVLAGGVLAAMVVAAAMNWMPMLLAAMLAAGCMILTRCCSINEARRSVDWSVLIVIGAALGLGRALDASGASDLVADSLLALAGSNPWLVLIAVYVVTSLMTEMITNNAAVALTFPLAHSAAAQLGVNFFPFVIAIMIAGSASFATPLGYQTNLMVYGPGGYRFSDFLRVGIPMNVLIGATTLLLTPLIWPF